MFTLEMLPAYYGDSLWTTYGSNNSAFLIDGGLAGTYDSIIARAGTKTALELFCITHIDQDHIQGAVKLLANLPQTIDIAEVWFNGYDHLTPEQRLGAKQGEELTAAIVNHAKLPWNKLWNDKAVVVPPDGPLPVITLPGGMRVTLLSPRQSELDRLKITWEKECQAAGIMPGDIDDAERVLAADRSTRLGDHINVRELAAQPYSADSAPANGSSIAFLAEFKNTTVLYGADAQSEVLAPAIRRLLKERGVSKLPLTACKVPHHGSKFNNSPDFIELLDCPRWLVSTSGKRFNHPDPETIARILIAREGAQTEFYFNYRSDRSEAWDNEELAEEWNYEAHYPKKGNEGLTVVL